MQKKELNALYYPETICLDEGLLKYLILLYDKVYFLPNDTELSGGARTLTQRFSIVDGMLAGAFGTQRDAFYMNLFATEKKAWDDTLKRLGDTYDFLEAEGRCIALNDKAFENARDWHPLQTAVDADINDKAFVDLCVARQNEKIYIPKNKTAGRIKSGALTMRPARYQGADFMVAIASERINATLLFGGQLDLVPVCNKGSFIDLMGRKLQRGIDNKLILEARAAIKEKRKVQVSILSYELFIEVVPSDVLQRKSFEQILKYKTECQELQESFRTYIGRLGSMIKAEPWEREFDDEISNIFQGEVKPEIERIRNEKKIIWEKIFKEALKETLVLIPALGVYLIPGFSYHDLLKYSTGGVAALASLCKIFPNLINLAQEERELNRNALFFLLRIK